ERFAALPDFDFAPHYIEQDGLRLHYLDEGAGEPILLLHGEPTWSFLYRKMIPTLARSARVVAPDYFGFGRSDKPTARDFYTYDRHYHSVARLVAAPDLRRLTLVAPDRSGPAPTGRRDARGGRGPAKVDEADARPVQRRRPDLHARRRRAARRPHPRRGAGRDPRRRRALPPGGQGRGDRDTRLRVHRTR